jgi:hypothetical protein
MRKIIAVTFFCFFSIFFKNEKAICKSFCNTACKMKGKQLLYDGGVYKDGNDNSPKQFDGFFFKI